MTEHPVTQPVAYATFDDLASKTEVPTRDVDLGDGRVVQVRGLTRAELIRQGIGDPDPDVVEQRMLAACLLQPKLSLQQVEKWQKRPGTIQEIARVTEAIRDLSGLGQGAQKSRVAANGDGA